jgi:hypothetical protein
MIGFIFTLSCVAALSFITVSVVEGLLNVAQRHWNNKSNSLRDWSKYSDYGGLVLFAAFVFYFVSTVTLDLLGLECIKSAIPNF